MNNILVVCIGNICRSPMAEGYFKQVLPDFNVLSAGVGALVGRPADPIAVRLMAEVGVNISSHLAQQISLALVSQADIIFVMDSEQKRYIEKQYVGSRGKVFRLAESAKVDIPDPYKEGIESFRLAQRLISDGVEGWARQINQLA